MAFGHGIGQCQRFFGQRFGRGRELVKQLLAGQRCQQFALHRLTADDHVQRGFHAQHARQTLRAAGAGNQAQLDLGQRNAGARRGDAVVAAQRQFQPAPHGHAVHGGDHRLGGVFQGQDHAQQVRLLQRFGRAKFADVGTARKGLAGTGNHDGLDRGVVIGAVQAGGNALARGQAQTVDRRVVQRDDGDLAVYLVFSGHERLPCDGCGRKKYGRSFFLAGLCANATQDPTGFARLSHFLVTLGTKMPDSSRA